MDQVRLAYMVGPLTKFCSEANLVINPPVTIPVATNGGDVDGQHSEGVSPDSQQEDANGAQSPTEQSTDKDGPESDVVSPEEACPMEAVREQSSPSEHGRDTATPGHETAALADEVGVADESTGAATSSLTEANEATLVGKQQDSSDMLENKRLSGSEEPLASTQDVRDQAWTPPPEWVLDTLVTSMQQTETRPLDLYRIFVPDAQHMNRAGLEKGLIFLELKADEVTLATTFAALDNPPEGIVGFKKFKQGLDTIKRSNEFAQRIAQPHYIQHLADHVQRLMLAMP